MAKINAMLEKLFRKFWRMFENFDLDCFKLRKLLEYIRKFWEIFRNLINSFNCLPVLTKMCFNWLISISETNTHTRIKCKSIRRHPNGSAPRPSSPTPRALGGRRAHAPCPYARNAPGLCVTVTYLMRKYVWKLS